ncbi:hypothetical protein EJ04DRAFT_55999 [Polyplosphaeria fusca]|uniref:Uncharacterized protein n=1 Tax=Polyplosphaeria fusca TaxID=682080 RepID=A0A9P4QQT6_9PLEO|nr:hypothetical protein EJ04DRAFT_55999 [Polyplosphaeria fusca]
METPRQEHASLTSQPPTYHAHQSINQEKKPASHLTSAPTPHRSPFQIPSIQTLPFYPNALAPIGPRPHLTPVSLPSSPRPPSAQTRLRRLEAAELSALSIGQEGGRQAPRGPRSADRSEAAASLYLR